MNDIDLGRCPSDPGCQPSASAADASSQSGIPNAGDWHLCGEERGGCQCMQIWSRAADAPVAIAQSGDWGDEYPSLRLNGPSMSATAEAYMEKSVYGHIPQDQARVNAYLITAAPDLLAVAHLYLEDAARWKFDGPGVRAAREAITRASGIVAATAGETRQGLDERSEQSPVGDSRDAQPPPL